jgi:nitrite reductase/ring-hydroxylating ferredoxin subunit
MLRNLLGHAKFILKYRTLKRIVVSRENAAKITVCHNGAEVELPRRCPHQGGPLDKGHIQNGRLHCPWHGCYYELDNKKFCPKTFVLQK